MIGRSRSGPRRRAGRPRRRAPSRPCCAGSGGVRRPAGRPASPGRTPPPRGRASRSAARRSCRRAGRSGRCSAGPRSARSAGRGGRRRGPRGRRRGWPSGGRPGRPSRRARPGRPRCRCGRARDPPWPAPAPRGSPSRAGRRRCRRTPARARPRARPRHCSTPVSSVSAVLLVQGNRTTLPHPVSRERCATRTRPRAAGHRQRRSPRSSTRPSIVRKDQPRSPA